MVHDGIALGCYECGTVSGAGFLSKINANISSESVPASET